MSTLFSQYAGAAQGSPDPTAASRVRAINNAEARIARLKACMANAEGCPAQRIQAAILHLTASEIERALGRPLYHLHIGDNDLYYWTVPVSENGKVRATRLSVEYGDCYAKEKGSGKEAACRVTRY